MLKLIKTSIAALVIAAPAHAVTVFSGHDVGAGSLAAAPNATAAAAAFDAAVSGTTIVDFEGPTGIFSFTPDAFVRNTQRCAPALCGYNTTSGGANFLDVTFNATFNFSTAISAFGAYFTGVQRGDATLTYTDGSQTVLTLPAAQLSSGGTSFFGFNDPGKMITSISYFTGTGGDFVGVDDIRLKVASAAIPLPASLPLLLAGVGVFGALRRRKKS